ncbi:MAG: hypothetical protein GX659_05535 [Myxococcales bacterium]|nr:hypothetical protein [Myxococcales bacterium]
MSAAASNATQRTLGSLESDSAFKNFIRRIGDGCFSYADADANAVTEAEYLEFSKDLQYEDDRFAFANTCVDHFNSLSSLPPAVGPIYKKFYEVAKITDAEISEINAELEKTPSEPKAPSDSKWELGLLITLNGAKALISDGSTFTANGDYSDEGSGGQLVFNPRIGFEGAYYFSGTNMKGWKAVFGVGLEVPVTGTHYNASDMIDQYPKVGIGAYGMVGIGGTIGSEKAAFDADISAIVGGRYVNNVVLPDSGVVSEFMGFLDLALRLGVKIKAGERAFLIPGFQLIFSPDIPGMTQISFKATNSDVQEVQGRVSPGGGDGFNVNGGFVLRATWK